MFNLIFHIPNRACEAQYIVLSLILVKELNGRLMLVKKVCYGFAPLSGCWIHLITSYHRSTEISTWTFNLHHSQAEPEVVNDLYSQWPESKSWLYTFTLLTNSDACGFKRPAFWPVLRVFNVNWGLTQTTSLQPGALIKTLTSNIYCSASLLSQMDLYIHYDFCRKVTVRLEE